MSIVSEVKRWVELVVLFALIPALVVCFIGDLATWLMPLLLLTGAGCLYLLLADPSFKRFRLWHVDAFYQHMRKTLWLFLPFASLACVLVAVYMPKLLFYLPGEHPSLWLLTLLIYPLISVIPQEVIFRTFFFHRYKRILPSKIWRWLLSTLSFASVHAVYGNWIAVAVSAAGGALFGYRYIQTRSTLVVVIEHSLWGMFLFTVGVGVFLLSNAPIPVE